MVQHVLPCSPKAEKVFCGSFWRSGYFLLQQSEVKSTRQSQPFTSHGARKPLLCSPRYPATAPGISLTRLLFCQLFPSFSFVEYSFWSQSSRCLCCHLRFVGTSEHCLELTRCGCARSCCSQNSSQKTFPWPQGAQAGWDRMWMSQVSPPCAVICPLSLRACLPGGR